MDKNHLLNLQTHKVIRCLKLILEQDELGKIEAELNRNVKQLLRLAQTHLRFAKKAEGPSSWRQQVSRGYYGAYCTSRAIRLAVSGFYNIDPGDHKRIGNLPSEFPSKSIWEDFLMKFRADRNLADYDHTVSEKDLEIRSQEYMVRSDNFYQVARGYLIDRGVI